MANCREELNLTGLEAGIDERKRCWKSRDVEVDRRRGLGDPYFFSARRVAMEKNGENYLNPSLRCDSAR